jgi:hypothetical protein
MAITAVSLNAAFVVLTRAETYIIADTCAEADGALGRARGKLYHQFVAGVYAGGMEWLDGWYKDYAIRAGATVSESGRVSTATIPADKLESFKAARNSFNVAKSTLSKAYENADAIAAIIDDGGSVFLDGNGFPRSRNDILALVAKATKAEAPEADDADAVEAAQLPKALSSLATAIKQASRCDDSDIAEFIRMAREQLSLLARGDIDAE